MWGNRKLFLHFHSNSISFIHEFLTKQESFIMRKLAFHFPAVQVHRQISVCSHNTGFLAVQLEIF